MENLIVKGNTGSIEKVKDKDNVAELQTIVLYLMEERKS